MVKVVTTTTTAIILQYINVLCQHVTHLEFAQYHNDI